MGKVKTRRLLQELVRTVISTISDCLAEGALTPHYIRCTKRKVTEFECDDNGIKRLNYHEEEFTKPFWPHDKVFQQVIKLDIYSEACKAISKDYGLDEGKVNNYLHNLMARITNGYLLGKVKSLAGATKCIDIFIKDLQGEEQEYRAEVQLIGLMLQSDSIQLDSNTRLRKPIREDFEGETFGLSFEQIDINPTAFLNTSIYASEPNAIMHEIDRDIAMLRLFRISSVQDIRYNLETDSIVKFAPSGGRRGNPIGPDKYLIKNEEAETLKVFWSNIKSVGLPDSAYPRRPQIKQDELSIAYQRYCDSLEARLLEKRISSAVMGLEALYLKPDERQELTYRLSMRAGKLLDQIGYSASEVRRNLVHAYDIRSTYVHGKTLSLKKRKEHEKKVGDLNDFPKVIMDYLRASIVALLKRPSKISLIQNIDDSFLDIKKEENIGKSLFMPYEKEE